MTRVDLLRHGFAVPTHPSGDAARTLTAAGRSAIQVLGEYLGRTHWRPDRAYSSPYVRARDTAAIVLGAAGVPIAAGILGELEPETDPEQTARTLAALLNGARHVLLVAHLPLLGRLAGYWADLAVPLAPGELVGIEFAGLPGPRAGRIVERNAPR